MDSITCCPTRWLGDRLAWRATSSRARAKAGRGIARGHPPGEGICPRRHPMPLPQLKPNQVLIKAYQASVCGSERYHYRGITVRPQDEAKAGVGRAAGGAQD